MNENEIVSLYKEKEGLKRSYRKYKHYYNAVNNIVRNELYYKIEGLKVQENQLLYKLNDAVLSDERKKIIQTSVKVIVHEREELESIYHKCLDVIKENSEESFTTNNYLTKTDNTDEEFDFYKDIKNNPNNISFWYPKIENCGIRTPETCIIQLPREIVKAFFMDNPDIDRIIIHDYIKNVVFPQLPENLKNRPVFIKNGTFSNKFYFKSCCCFGDTDTLISSLIDINYSALCFDAGGITEIAVRERIPYKENETACIYNGMPLRPEFRVFYDFNTRHVLYTVNYWDKDYCEKSISRNRTDRIIYKTVYPEIKNAYEKNVSNITALVENHMKNVDMHDIWSVDILLDETNTPWLIDMAIAQQSAYWDKNKICY